MILEQLRAQVDSIDDQLVSLLNRRAQLGLDILQEKRRLGLPIYDAERERQVLGHVQQQNQGPLDSEQLTLIFKAIIEACRTIQQTRKGTHYGNCNEK